MKLDPRIEPIFTSRPAHERFLVIALCALLAKVDKDGDLLSEVIDEFKGQEIDWTEIVAGRALFHYNGKTRQQLEREGFRPDAIRQVATALKRRGIAMPDEPKPKVNVEPVTPKTEAPKIDPPKPEVETEEPPAQTPQAQDVSDAGEPLYAGHPLSFYSGMDRKAILAVENVSPKVADQIQAAINAATK